MQTLMAPPLSPGRTSSSPAVHSLLRAPPLPVELRGLSKQNPFDSLIQLPFPSYFSLPQEGELPPAVLPLVQKYLTYFRSKERAESAQNDCEEHDLLARHALKQESVGTVTFQEYQYVLNSLDLDKHRDSEMLTAYNTLNGYLSVVMQQAWAVQKQSVDFSERVAAQLVIDADEAVIHRHEAKLSQTVPFVCWYKDCLPLIWFDVQRFQDYFVAIRDISKSTAVSRDLELFLNNESPPPCCLMLPITHTSSRHGYPCIQTTAARQFSLLGMEITTHHCEGEQHIHQPDVQTHKEISVDKDGNGVVITKTVQMQPIETRLKEKAFPAGIYKLEFEQANWLQFLRSMQYNYQHPYVNSFYARLVTGPAQVTFAKSHKDEYGVDYTCLNCKTDELWEEYMANEYKPAAMDINLRTKLVSSRQRSSSRPRDTIVNLDQEAVQNGANHSASFSMGTVSADTKDSHLPRKSTSMERKYETFEAHHSERTKGIQDNYREELRQKRRSASMERRPERIVDERDKEKWEHHHHTTDHNSTHTSSMIRSIEDRDEHYEPVESRLRAVNSSVSYKETPVVKKRSRSASRAVDAEATTTASTSSTTTTQNHASRRSSSASRMLEDSQQHVKPVEKTHGVERNVVNKRSTSSERRPARRSTSISRTMEDRDEHFEPVESRLREGESSISYKETPVVKRRSKSTERKAAAAVPARASKAKKTSASTERKASHKRSASAERRTHKRSASISRTMEDRDEHFDPVESRLREVDSTINYKETPVIRKRSHSANRTVHADATPIDDAHHAPSHNTTHRRSTSISRTLEDSVEYFEPVVSTLRPSSHDTDYKEMGTGRTNRRSRSRSTQRMTDKEEITHHTATHHHRQRSSSISRAIEDRDEHFKPVDSKLRKTQSTGSYLETPVTHKRRSRSASLGRTKIEHIAEPSKGEAASHHRHHTGAHSRRSSSVTRTLEDSQEHFEPVSSRLRELKEEDVQAHPIQKPVSSRKRSHSRSSSVTRRVEAHATTTRKSRTRSASRRKAGETDIYTDVYTETPHVASGGRAERLAARNRSKSRTAAAAAAEIKIEETEEHDHKRIKTHQQTEIRGVRLPSAVPSIRTRSVSMSRTVELASTDRPVTGGDLEMTEMAITQHAFTTFSQLLTQGRVNAHSRVANDRTLLILCAMHGSFEIAKHLISLGCEVNAVDSYGMTALMYAAYYCRTNISRLLLQHGADCTIRDKLNNTALHFAVANPTSSLRSHSGTINTPQSANTTVQVLLDHHVPLDVQNSTRNTALHIACAQNNLWCAGMLVSAGANTHFANSEGKTCFDLLHNANLKEIICNPKIHSAEMDSIVLHSLGVQAVQYPAGSIEAHIIWLTQVFQHISTHNAAPKSIHAMNPEESAKQLQLALNDMHQVRFAFQDAIYKRDLSQIATLYNYFSNGADGSHYCLDMNAPQDTHGNTLLHYCAVLDFTPGLAYCVYKGANMNIVNNIKSTPLMYACIAGAANCAFWLIFNGCELDRFDKDQISAFHWSILAHRHHVTYLLAHNGCSYDDVDGNGNSALLSAAAAGDAVLCEQLIARNSSVHHLNSRDENALHMAVKGAAKQHCISKESDEAREFMNNQIALLHLIVSLQSPKLASVCAQTVTTPPAALDASTYDRLNCKCHIVLNHVARDSYMKTIQILLLAGVRKTHRDCLGRLPQSIANECKAEDIADLLIKCNLPDKAPSQQQV